MQSTFLTTLILSVILTPVFNSISFFINPRWQKKQTLFASCFASLASIALLVLMVRNPDLSGFSTTLYDWIAFQGKNSFELSIEFQVTILGTFFLITSNLLFTLLLLFQHNPPDDSSKGDQVLFYSAWAVGFSNLFLISDNLYLSFIFLEMVTLMIFLAGNFSRNSSKNALFNRRLFLNIHFFNLLLLSTFIFIHVHFETTRISEILSQVDKIESLRLDAPSVLFLISFLLMVSVAGRTGQFPFFGWSEHVSRQTSFVTTLIQTVTLVPISFYLLFRLYPLITGSPEACFLISVMGSLTVILVGLISLFQKSSFLSLGYLIAAVWGIVFSSMSLKGVQSWGQTAFFLLSALPVISLVILISELIRRSTEEKTDSIIAKHPVGEFQAGKIALLISIVYLFTGISTLSIIIEPLSGALFNTKPQAYWGEWSLFGLPPQKLMSIHYVLLLAGCFLISLSSFRFLLSLLRSTESSTGSGYSNRPGVFCFGSYLLLSLSVWLAGYWASSTASGLFLLGESQFKMGIPFQAGLIQLVSVAGAVSAWAFFSRKEKKTVAIKDGAFQRICRNRFYIEDIIFLGFLLPIRGIGQLSRFFDWLIIDGILVTLPSKIMKRVVWFYEPLESSEMPFPIVAVLSAIAVMFVTLCFLIY